MVLAKINGRDLSDLGPDEHALHKCDNIPCINPRHLEFGDNTKNQQDASRRIRGNETPGVRRWMDKETEIEYWRVSVERNGVRREAKLPTSKFSKEDVIAKREEFLQEVLKELEDAKPKPRYLA